MTAFGFACPRKPSPRSGKPGRVPLRKRSGVGRHLRSRSNRFLSVLRSISTAASSSGTFGTSVLLAKPFDVSGRLRAMKTDRNPLLFKIHMAAGHSGRVGRLESHRQLAEEYAFFLHQLETKAR